jgi:hypothetical protein
MDAEGQASRRFFSTVAIFKKKNLKSRRKTRLIFPVYVRLDVESPASCLGRLTIIVRLAVLNYVMNTYEWMEVQRCSFLFGIKWVSVSHSGRFIPHEINPCTNWIWVDLITRSRKYAANRRKLFLPLIEPRFLGPSARSQSLHWLRY